MTTAAVDCETHTFTREEFYAYVWSAPATQLSKELGCSDVMIGKVCKAFDVPKPYPGYWAQLANGKKPKKTRLPKNDDPDFQTLTFQKFPEHEDTVDAPPRELMFDPDIRKILEKARQLGPVKVGTTLHNAHQLVCATREHLENRGSPEEIHWSVRGRASRSEPPSTLSVEVGQDSTKRALRILDALIKRVEKLGGRVEVRHGGRYGYGSSTVVVIAGEEVTTLRLREKCNQVRRKNKEDPLDNDFELVPSGELQFDTGRGSYFGPLLKDSKKKKIEDKLAGFVIDLVNKAGEQRIYRREKEERDRRLAEEARIEREREEELCRRREALEKLQSAERARVEELLSHATAWSQSRLLREYLDAFRDACTAGNEGVNIDGTLDEFLRWGFEQADRIDPLRKSPHSVLDESVSVDEREPRVRKPR